MFNIKFRKEFLQNFPLFWDATRRDVVPEKLRRSDVTELVCVDVKNADVILLWIDDVSANDFFVWIVTRANFFVPCDASDAIEQLLLDCQNWKLNKKAEVLKPVSKLTGSWLLMSTVSPVVVYIDGSLAVYRISLSSKVSQMNR